jgi:cob(I)alamin adenosyltransferase
MSADLKQDETVTQMPPSSKIPQTGQIQIFTGDGKGKSVAALGLAFRALAQGWDVLMISFSKDTDNEAGDLMAGRQLLTPQAARHFTIIQTGAQAGSANRVMFAQAVKPSDALEISNGWQIAKRAALSGKYQLMVMDEANVAVDLGLIPLDEMKQLLQRKPPELELVLTGRNAHPDILAMADLISVIS